MIAEERPTPAGSFLVYNFGMNPSPIGSFAKFTIGFLVFISVSLGVTIAVNSYTDGQGQAQQTAAAIQALLKTEK